MIIVFAAALAGLLAWIGWVWRRTTAPIWTSLVTLVPVSLGGWCVVVMAGAFMAAHRVPETLTASEQVRQVAMQDARMMRWGMRFWAAGLVSAGWLLFVMWRWESPPGGTRGEPSDPE
jgi:hypothetical protein